MSSPAGTPRADRQPPRHATTGSRPGASAASAGGWRSLALITVAIWAITAAGALLGALAPSLAPGGQPHPTLRPTLAAAAGILAQNLRVLCAPFLLAAFRFDRASASRLAGDALVGGILAANALTVGLALGRLGARLIAYLPQLPLEYLAAAVAASAWTAARRQPSSARSLSARAALTAVLLCAAAAVEVLLTPHRV